MIALIMVMTLIVGFAILLGGIFMLLWNWIMPYLFGLPIISFWMAWGIMILAGLLFSGIKSSIKRK